MRYAWIADHRKSYPIKTMCKLLGVSTSGFYDWDGRDHAAKAAKQRRLVGKIVEIHETSKKRYGSPRVYRALRMADESVSKSKVERIMREYGIKAKAGRKYKATTDSKHSLPRARNLVERRFAPGEPNKIWCADITCIWTRQGWLYLAAIIDVGTRKIVGWAMDDNMRTDLVMQALQMATAGHGMLRNLIFHSDQGGQFASEAFKAVLEKRGIKQSMSRKGDCWDNAVIESFFHSLKVECIYGETFKTRKQAELAVFEYIEIFYNRYRLHSSLGYVSPECYERRLLAKAA